jgi:hypothetical protein
MENLPTDAPQPVSPEAEALYAGALNRITAAMPVLGTLGTAILWWSRGGLVALGFVAGCAISYVNFYWLKRVVNTLVERAVNSREGEGGRPVTRFVLRYALMAIAAYVIVSFSERSLYGLLAGLFLPVGAILCEAIYEVYMAFRRGL